VEEEEVQGAVPNLVEVAKKAHGSILEEPLVWHPWELAALSGSSMLAREWDCKDCLLVKILAHCCLLMLSHHHDMVSVRKQTEQCKHCCRAARLGYAQAALR